MPPISDWEALVHLAYLDESGTDGHCPFVIFGALVMPTGKFSPVEILHSTAIQQLLPVERIGEFKEFHACELYQGTGLFEGVDETKRLTAIQVLLTAVRVEKLHFVYAAADRKKFSQSPFGSGKPLNSAFHMCLLGVEEWATTNHPNPGHPEVKKTKMLDWKDTVLYILDESDDKNQKDQFRNIYRTLRAKYPRVPPRQSTMACSRSYVFGRLERLCRHSNG